MKRKPPKPAPAAITDDLIARLLQANLGNIVRKIKAHKPLTRAEQKTLEEQKQNFEPKERGHRPRGEKYAGGIAEAARILGVPIALVTLARKAGCDAFKSSGLIAIDELDKFIQENPKLQVDISDTLAASREIFLDRKAAREMREHRLAVARRAVIGVEEVRLSFTRAFVDCKKLFTEGIRTHSQNVALHCAAPEEKIAWAIAQGEKLAREILVDLSKKEWLGKCPNCHKEIK